MEHNLNLYHIFYTVAKCGNISTAAHQLYISQPAISKSISRLEQNLDTNLFIRSSRGVSLTMEGELLYKQVDCAFSAIRRGEEELQKVNELGIGRLSISVSTTLCRYVLLPYLQSFIHQNPHIKISISCQSSYQTIRALENGTVDIGLIGEPWKNGKIRFYPLREIQDIFVTTESYMENLKKRMNPNHSGNHESVFSQATLILLDKDNLTRQYIDKYVNQTMIENDLLIEVTTMDLLIEFAKIDLGIACVISDFVKEELANRTLIRLKSPMAIPKRKIGFACHKEASSNQAVSKFMNFMQNILPKGAS